jgi:hypothetical protein
VELVSADAVDCAAPQILIDRYRGSGACSPGRSHTLRSFEPTSCGSARHRLRLLTSRSRDDRRSRSKETHCHLSHYRCTRCGQTKCAHGEEHHCNDDFDECETGTGFSHAVTVVGRFLLRGTRWRSISSKSCTRKKAAIRMAAQFPILRECTAAAGSATAVNS